MPMINEAFFCLLEGVGSPHDIDTGMKLGTNQPMGPLALADLIGLDTCLSIMRTIHEGLGDSKYRPCPLLVQYVDAGWLGRKSGRGVYQYNSALWWDCVYIYIYIYLWLPNKTKQKNTNINNFSVNVIKGPFVLELSRELQYVDFCRICFHIWVSSRGNIHIPICQYGNDSCSSLVPLSSPWLISPFVLRTLRSSFLKKTSVSLLLFVVQSSQLHVMN